MSNVTTLKSWRERKGLAPAPVDLKPTAPPTREEVIDALLARYSKYQQELVFTVARKGHTAKRQGMLRQLCVAAARRLVALLSTEGWFIHYTARFQFTALMVDGVPSLIGRVSRADRPGILVGSSVSANFYPCDLTPQVIAFDDTISKSDSITPLITLPMTEFYRL